MVIKFIIKTTEMVYLCRLIIICDIIGVIIFMLTVYWRGFYEGKKNWDI